MTLLTPLKPSVFFLLYATTYLTAHGDPGIQSSTLLQSRDWVTLDTEAKPRNDFHHYRHSFFTQDLTQAVHRAGNA
jgi:hypothetical protein